MTEKFRKDESVDIGKPRSDQGVCPATHYPDNIIESARLANSSQVAVVLETASRSIITNIKNRMGSRFFFEEGEIRDTWQSSISESLSKIAREYTNHTEVCIAQRDLRPFSDAVRYGGPEAINNILPNPWYPILAERGIFNSLPHVLYYSFVQTRYTLNNNGQLDFQAIEHCLRDVLAENRIRFFTKDRSKQVNCIGEGVAINIALCSNLNLSLLIQGKEAYVSSIDSGGNRRSKKELELEYMGAISK